MKNPGLQIILYLGSGGMILTWLNPQEGMSRFALIPLVILMLSVVHSMLDRGQSAAKSVVSLKAFQSGKRKDDKTATGKERKPLQMVFHTFFYEEVEQLVQTMRDKGLHPMMVTQSKTGDFGEPVYQIMLPEAEARRGQGLAERFRGKKENRS